MIVCSINNYVGFDRISLMKTAGIYGLSIILGLVVAWVSIVPSQVDAASLQDKIGAGECSDHVTGPKCPQLPGSPDPCIEHVKVCCGDGDGTCWGFDVCKFSTKCDTDTAYNCIF